MSYAAWGNVGNVGYAIPMVQLLPTTPDSQGYMLAWNTTEQAIGYFPINCDFATGDATSAGNFGVASGKVFKVDGLQVVAARDTGWAAMTGSSNKAAVYDTATVTLPQLAGRVMALQAVLTSHGLIGA